MSNVANDDSMDLFVKVKDGGQDASREDDGKLSQDLANEIEAFGQYFSDHHKDLHGYANVMLNDHHLSEDIVQQAFVNTIGALRRDVDISNYSAWAHRCIHNLALNHIRRIKPDPVDSQEELEELGTDAKIDRDQPESAFNSQEKLKALMSSVDSLPNHLRAAFLLAEVHGYNYREIADLMDRSVASTAQILFRARAKVRKLYDKDVFGNFTPPVDIGLLAKASISFRLIQQKVLAKVSGALQMGSAAGTPDQIMPQLAANVIAVVVATGLAVNPGPAPGGGAAQPAGPANASINQYAAVYEAPALGGETQASNNGATGENADTETGDLAYIDRARLCMNGPVGGARQGAPGRCMRAQMACRSSVAASKRSDCGRKVRNKKRLGKHKSMRVARAAFKKKRLNRIKPRKILPRNSGPIHYKTWPPSKPKPPKPPGACLPHPQCPNVPPPPPGDEDNQVGPRLPANLTPAGDGRAVHPRTMAPDPSGADTVDRNVPPANDQRPLPGPVRPAGRPPAFPG